MPLIQDKVTVAAGATEDNLLEGSAFLTLPYNAIVEFATNASADDDALVTVMAGSDILQQEGLASAANRYPIYPDDYTLSSGVTAGTRLTLRIRNQDGTNAVDVFYGVRITPV